MDKYVIEVDGEEVAVTLSDTGTALTATVGDRVYELESLPAGRDALSLKLGTGSRTAWVAGSQDHYRVRLGRVALEATVRSEREWHLERTGGLSARGGAQGALKSPMPGKVLKLLVAAGDVVEPGQPLAILEAMKMENELRASGRAKVTRVAVTPGTAVEGGVVLVEFGPAEAP